MRIYSDYDLFFIISCEITKLCKSSQYLRQLSQVIENIKICVIIKLTEEVIIMNNLTNIITNYYVRKNLIPKDKVEIYAYGFKLIIADVINYTIIITLGIIFNKVLESICFLISLCGLRQFCGGFHAKTFCVCRMSMIITYICVMYLTSVVIHTGYNLITVLTIDILSVSFISVFAPIVNYNKPLSSIQKRSNKIHSIIASILLSAVSIILIIADIKIGVTISITLLAVIILMIIGMAKQKGGKANV